MNFLHRISVIALKYKTEKLKKEKKTDSNYSVPLHATALLRLS